MNAADVKNLSDDQLIERVEYLVKRERQVVERLIWHLQEIQDRKLYIEMGYTTLFECLVKRFRYSEPVAYGRISALRIIKEIPTVAEALNNGELNLTTLCLAQTHFRKLEKRCDQPVTADQKIQLIENLKNKSTNEVKQLLAETNPEMDLPLDQVKYLNADQAQLLATVDKDLLKKIEYLKSIISHENINPSFNELLHCALDAAIEKTEKRKGLLVRAAETKRESKIDISKKETRREREIKTVLKSNLDVNHRKYDRSDAKKLTQSFAVKNSRYISRGVKRSVFKRAQSRCEFVHQNGQRCASVFQPQLDHIIAFSKGGTSAIENIQLLCRVHNASKSNQ